jgi:hypothetical protein
MTGVLLLETALWLGLTVLLAGCYGILYGVGRLTQRRAVSWAAFGCYGMQCTVAGTIVLLAPLNADWKFVLAAFTLGFLVVPPVTWSFLERTH